MNTAPGQEIIEAMLAQYGLSMARVDPIESNNHCVVRVAAASGTYCLKLDTAVTEIRLRSQLEYMEYLSDGGLPVMDVIRATSGDSIAKVSDTVGVLFGWIDGASLEKTTEPALLEESGALLAGMHLRAAEIQPSTGFDRPRWDQTYAPSEDGWLRDFFARSLVDDAARETIARAARRVHTTLQSLPNDTATYGLIHADFHGGNLIHDGKMVRVIDFDDSGWGHWLFDITWPAVIFAKAHGSPDGFLNPFLKGYERLRPLTGMETDLFHDFMLAAGLAVVEMIHSSSLEERGSIATEWYGFAVDWLGELLAEPNPMSGRS